MSEWQRLQSGVAAFTLDLAEGRPKLYPETPVTLARWKREIDATPWLVTEIEHSLGDSGFGTRLQYEVKGA